MWLEVWSVVPFVTELILRYYIFGEKIASGNASENRPPSEGLSGVSSWIKVGELMDIALVGHNSDPTLVMLHSTTDCNRNGPQHGAAEDPAQPSPGLVIPSNFTIILPWYSFGSSHVLSKTVCNPWI